MTHNAPIPFLKLLARLHARLRTFSIALGRYESITSKTHSLDITEQADFVAVTECVDAEVTCGEALCWRVEIACTPNDCTVRVDVSRIQSHGGSTLVTIAEFKTVEFGQLATLTWDAVEELCREPERFFDLQPPDWREIAKGKSEWTIEETYPG